MIAQTQREGLRALSQNIGFNRRCTRCTVRIRQRDRVRTVRFVGDQRVVCNRRRDADVGCQFHLVNGCERRTQRRVRFHQDDVNVSCATVQNTTDNGQRPGANRVVTHATRHVLARSPQRHAVAPVEQQPQGVNHPMDGVVRQRIRNSDRFDAISRLDHVRRVRQLRCTHRHYRVRTHEIQDVRVADRRVGDVQRIGHIDHVGAGA